MIGLHHFMLRRVVADPAAGTPMGGNVAPIPHPSIDLDQVEAALAAQATAQPAASTEPAAPGA